MKKSNQHILAGVILLVAAFLVSTLIFALVVMINKGGDDKSSELSSYLQEDIVVDRVTIGSDTFFIEPIDTETVAITGYTGSDVLHAVSIPEKLDGKKVVKIAEGAFMNKTSITAVAFPKTLETIEPYAFTGCLGLKTLTIPNSISSIGEGAFSMCASLETVIFADGTAMTEIAERTFMGCSSLENIVIPGEIEKIGKGAFALCIGLTDLTIEDGVKTISSWAFLECTKLETVVISASVTTFEADEQGRPYAFGGCENLYLDGITCPAGSAAETYFRDVLALAESAPVKE